MLVESIDTYTFKTKPSLYVFLLSVRCLQPTVIIIEQYFIISYYAFTVEHTFITKYHC